VYDIAEESSVKVWRRSFGRCGLVDVGVPCFLVWFLEFLLPRNFRQKSGIGGLKKIRPNENSDLLVTSISD